ncbi:RNA-binding protein lark [Gryllus bimaculatus]|nr:RNA-binding protein lark [Gryllus bimaculatus]
MRPRPITPFAPPQSNTGFGLAEQRCINQSQPHCAYSAATVLQASQVALWKAVFRPCFAGPFRAFARDATAISLRIVLGSVKLGCGLHQKAKCRPICALPVHPLAGGGGRGGARACVHPRTARGFVGALSRARVFMPASASARQEAHDSCGLYGGVGVGLGWTREMQKTKIFVGRLPEEAQSQDLRRLFEQYGVVTECDILNRYGFVHMKTEEMAARAIQELNNAEFMGVQISVEQSTGKKSGRGATRGGFGPMRGRGTMRGGMGRAPPYMRDGRGDYDRRPGMPPPPSMRNGYYDSYDRGYDNYYPSRGPPPPIMPSRDSRDPERRSYPDMMRAPYERRSFSEVGRSPYDRPSMPGVASFERRSDYSGSRISSDIYRRRTPPPPSSYGGAGYERENMDPYGPPARRYDRENMEPFGPPVRR